MENLQTTADMSTLTARIAALIDAGRPAAARPLLAAVRCRVPPSPDLSVLGARLFLCEGHSDLALRELDEAITLHSEHAGLRKCRTDVRIRLGDHAGAAADAAEAVILDSSDPEAKARLGVLMLELKRPADAVACLGEAVSMDPRNPTFREGLAAAQEANGDTDAGLATLNAGIADMPWRTELRNAADLLSIRRRDFACAHRLAEDARVAGVMDACSFGLMGHALSSLGRHAEAADAYAEALKLGPNDPYVRHLAAATGVQSNATRAPVEYLRTIFDGYADRFEEHLIALGYRVPGLIRAALLKHATIAAGERLGPVLDLGCGTGLVAVVLSNLPVAPLIGVDVSSRMLASAAAKQLYADLRETDLMQFLAEDVTGWKAILAGDVLVYFGALPEVMAAIHSRLDPGGWFVFTVEELLPDHHDNVNDDGDWVLERMGRYAHSMSYVTRTAQEAGFAIRTLERQTLRYESDAPVAGIFVVLERERHDD
jgi:predicted TPR repeat methyltransferase